MRIETIHDERWVAAIHEASHAIAERAINGNALVGAVLLGDGRGLTYGGGHTTSYAAAICDAAGVAAETLLAIYPDPPATSGSVGQDVRSTEWQDRLERDMSEATGDRQRVTRWASNVAPSNPAPLTMAAYQAAMVFVWGHAEAIVDLASELYRRGHILLTDTPTRHPVCISDEG